MSAGNIASTGTERLKNTSLSKELDDSKRLFGDSFLLAMRLASDISYGTSKAAMSGARAFGEQLHDDKLFEHGVVRGLLVTSLGAASVASEQLAMMVNNALSDVREMVETPSKDKPEGGPKGGSSTEPTRGTDDAYQA